MGSFEPHLAKVGLGYFCLDTDNTNYTKTGHRIGGYLPISILGKYGSCKVFKEPSGSLYFINWPFYLWAEYPCFWDSFFYFAVFTNYIL